MPNGVGQVSECIVGFEWDQGRDVAVDQRASVTQIDADPPLEVPCR